jgi:Kef-type K+ transport system membrane component KefB
MSTEEEEPLSDDDAFALLYRLLCFLVCLYVDGDVVCQRGLRIVPALVGQIVVGLVFGPDVGNWFLTEESSAQLMLSTAGQLGLVLMLCQAGSQMDLALLQQTGIRSVVMAVTGSILPTAIGFGLAYTIVLDDVDKDWKSALAVGCSFGPTSAGIALAVLEQCQVLQTPVGQLVVAVAIVDDIIALVVLSQLRVLTQTDVTPSQIVIPIVSALLWLAIGSIVAIRGMPLVLERLKRMEQTLSPDGDSVTYQNSENVTAPQSRQSTVLAHENESTIEARANDKTTPGTSLVDTDGSIPRVLTENDIPHTTRKWNVLYATVLLLILLPATYYTEASFFLGAFLAGLGLATRSQAALELEQSWKDVTDWLMRLFFGATIAFAIPVSLWWEEPQTLAYGVLLALALLGKLAVGPLLTPVLSPEGHRWDRNHIRDCLVVGCSMMGEAEFAFVVAAFGLDQGLIPETVYASVTFAILLSTILSPILLRLVLTTFSIVPQRKNRP